jgi:hypothetical protein
VLDAQKILRIIHSFHRDRKIKVSGRGSSLKIYQTTCVGTCTIKCAVHTKELHLFVIFSKKQKSKSAFKKIERKAHLFISVANVLNS